MSNMYGVALWVSLVDVNLLANSLVNGRLYILIVGGQAAHYWHQDQGEQICLGKHDVPLLLANQEFLLQLQSGSQPKSD